MGATQSPAMTAALKMILQDGKSAAEASRACDITKGAISKNAQYRAHVDKLKQEKARNEKGI